MKNVLPIHFLEIASPAPNPRCIAVIRETLSAG